MPTKNRGSIIIHTDGSCDPNPGPSAIAFEIRQGPNWLHKAKYIGFSTINRSELLAAIAALEAVQAMRQFIPDLVGAPIHLFTDSQYVAYTVTQNWAIRANKPHWEKYCALHKALEPRMTWISRNDNLTVDELAWKSLQSRATLRSRSDAWARLLPGRSGSLSQQAAS